MTSLTTDPDFHMKLALYRRKAADNTITIEEMREAVLLMRQGRITASASAAAKTSRAKKAPINSDDLLNELEGL